MAGISTRLEVRHLRYFVAIVDAGSFSRAATQVGVAQPALSQQIAQLEDILGAQLLLRSRAGVKPTASGAALYRHAEAILRMVSETKDAVIGSGMKISGRVRLGLPSSIAVVLADALVTAVRERFPLVNLELHENPSAYLEPQLRNEHVDLSVLVETVADGGVHLTPLVNESLFYVTAKQVRGAPLGGTMSLEALAHVPLVLTTSATTLRQMLNDGFLRSEVSPVVYAEVSSIPTMLLFVGGEVGTIVPGSAIAGRPDLYAYAIKPEICRRASLAHSTAAPLSAASEQVHSILLETVKDLVTTCRWLGATLC